MEFKGFLAKTPKNTQIFHKVFEFIYLLCGFSGISQNAKMPKSQKNRVVLKRFCVCDFVFKWRDNVVQ